jgi:AcrR family transcriptional regulator
LSGPCVRAKPTAMHSDDDGGKRGYHHGNLREALVFAAIGLIADKGVQGFTFAEAARAAGVSPAAPYRHFRDREALMAEVARYGFERFADRLEAAWNRGRPNPLVAFETVGRAYLAFAREERPLFAAMFQAGLPKDPALKSASDRAFEALLTACRGLTLHLPPGQRPPLHMMSYHIWAFSHGIAELFTGASGLSRAPISADDMLESGLVIYLRGLGLIPGEN